MTKRFGLLSHLLRQAKGTEDLLYPDPHGKKTHALQMAIKERGKEISGINWRRTVQAL